MITVRGECWPDGRKVFTRQYTKPQMDPPLAERDEGAEQLCQRIVNSAVHAMSQREKLRAALASDSTAYTTPNASPETFYSSRYK